MKLKRIISVLAICLLLISIKAQTWPPERKDVLHYVATPFNYNFELGLCPCLQGDPFNQSNCFSQGLNAEWEYLIRIDSDNFELNFPAGMNQDTISRSPTVFGSSKHQNSQFFEFVEYTAPGNPRPNYQSTFVSVIEYMTPFGVTGYYINDTFNYRSVITYGDGYVIQGQAGHRNYGLDWHHYTNTAVTNPVEFCNDKDHYLPFLFLLLTHDFFGQGLGNSVYSDPFGGYKSNDGKFWLTDSVIQSYVDYHISDSINAYGYHPNYTLISNPPVVGSPYPPVTPAPAVINMTYDSYIVNDTFQTTSLNSLPKFYVYNISYSDTSFAGSPPAKYWNSQYEIKVKDALVNHSSYLKATGDSILCTQNGEILDIESFFTHLDPNFRGQTYLFGGLNNSTYNYKPYPDLNIDPRNLQTNPAIIDVSLFNNFPYGEFYIQGFYYDSLQHYCTYEFNDKLSLFDNSSVSAGNDIILCDQELGFLQPSPLDDYSSWEGNGSDLIIADQVIVPLLFISSGITDSTQLVYNYTYGCETLDTVSVYFNETPQIDSNFLFNIISVNYNEVCVGWDLTPIGLSNNTGDTVGITIENNYYLDDNVINYCHSFTNEVDTINYSIFAGNSNGCQNMYNGFVVVTHFDSLVTITDTLLQIDTIVQLITDTVTITDTTTIIDTTIIIDTIIQIDTIYINDTTFVFDTTYVFDTIRINDTIVINNNDTLFQNISTTLTPNGDGINEYWVIQGLDNWDKKQVSIYNRWGGIVYDNPNYDNSFNGYANRSTVGSNKLPTGTYYYLIKLEKQGESLTKSGYLFIKH